MLVVYDFSCPSCGAKYSNKTERTLHEWTVEHLYTDNNSTIYKDLDDCTGIQHLFDIASLYSSLITSTAPIQKCDKFDLRITRIALVEDNAEITDRHKNWNTLFLKETLKI